MKYVILLVVFFLTGCGGCISDSCYLARDKIRIANMTEEEKLHEKQRCIEFYEYQIKITKNEKTHCNFWKCTYGRDSKRKSLEHCVRRFDNIKEETK